VDFQLACLVGFEKADLAIVICQGMLRIFIPEQFLRIGLLSLVHPLRYELTLAHFPCLPSDLLILYTLLVAPQACQKR
jgi:hypothetical protein